MTRVYEPFDSFATEYDFQANLLSKNNFSTANLSHFKGAALDIGCGSGILAFELAKHYATIVAIDISKEMLALAQQKRSAPNIQYIHMDADHLSLDRKFDLITSSGTFHHLQNLQSTLQAIKELLNPQGKVVLRDVVSEVETPATIVYLLGAAKDFIPDCLKYGVRNAWRLFRFRTSPPWLRHLASDKYLSEQQFKEVYSSVFPGCSFTREGCFMSMTWEYL